MAVDILAAVYEFVKAYAYNPEDANSKQLTADQIIRAGLNDAPVVSTSTEREHNPARHKPLSI